MTIGSRKFSVGEEEAGLSSTASAQRRDNIFVRPYQEIMVTKGGKSKDLAPPVCITRDQLAQHTEGSRKAFDGIGPCGGLDRPAWQCKGYLKRNCTSKPISKCEFIHCDISPEMAAEAARQAAERTRKEKDSAPASAFEEPKPPADSLASLLGPPSLASRWPKPKSAPTTVTATKRSPSPTRFSREKRDSGATFNAPPSRSVASSPDSLLARMDTAMVCDVDKKPKNSTKPPIFPLALSDPLCSSEEEDELALSFVSNESGFSWEQESKMTASRTPSVTPSPRSSPVPFSTSPVTAPPSEFPTNWRYTTDSENKLSESTKRAPVFPRPAIPRRAVSSTDPTVSPSISPCRPPLRLDESLLNVNDTEHTDLPMHPPQPVVPQTLLTSQNLAPVLHPAAFFPSTKPHVGSQVFVTATEPVSQPNSAPNHSVWPYAQFYQPSSKVQQQSDDPLLDLSPLLTRYAFDPLDPKTLGLAA